MEADQLAKIILDALAKHSTQAAWIGDRLPHSRVPDPLDDVTVDGVFDMIQVAQAVLAALATNPSNPSA